MQKFLPLLQSLAENHPDSEVQEMASDLRIAIATHGVVWSERLSKSSQTTQVCCSKQCEYICSYLLYYVLMKINVTICCGGFLLSAK